MKKIIPQLLALLTPVISIAQDPCAPDFEFRVIVGTRTTLDLTRMCDTFFVLSPAALEKLKIERAFYKVQAELLDSTVKALQNSMTLRDQLLARQDEFIEFQQDKLAEYDALLVKSNQLVTDATKNTDRALSQLNLAKWGTLGIVVGVVVGALLLK